MFSDPQEKILTIKNYANTGFVNIVLEKRFYMSVEKIADELGSKRDTIINNMLLLNNEKTGKHSEHTIILFKSKFIQQCLARQHYNSGYGKKYPKYF